MMLRFLMQFRYDDSVGFWVPLTQ